MKLAIREVGPIREADVALGDLTVLVGPQASGKSILLQMLELVVEAGYVQETMTRHGLDWAGKLPEFFDAFFGEGMRGIWREGESSVWWNGKSVDMPKLAARKRRDKSESLFFIPAQRVLALRDGWPRPFSDYSPGDPFAVRDFSEKLRALVEKEFGGDNLFPQEGRLKREFREMLESAFFGDYRLRIDKVRAQRRLVLSRDGDPLPYMVWSAGQREFVPLLLGLYWLMPPGKVSRRGGIEWVVLEELEMGLHPRAISVVVLMTLELIARGYRVCLSTHSPQVLEAVWTLRHLRTHGGDSSSLLKAFDAPSTAPMRRLADTVFEKNVKVYYCERETGKVHDISALDVDEEGLGQTDWGGLLEFSGRANSIVADAVANGRETAP